MKKTILATLALAATMAATAQTEVLKIELTDGSTQTIAVEKIKEMTFGEEEVPEEPSYAEKAAGTYTGTNTVVVGGNFTYTANCKCEITANPDGTVNFTWNSYSLKETVMGDLTLGTCTISNIAWDETQGGFYRDYSNDGITQHFTAEKDGTTSMDKDYELGETSTILIELTEAGIKVTNPFKLGAMPLPLTATFEGKVAGDEPSHAEMMAGNYTGSNNVVVGGNFTYTADCKCEITANPDGTVNFTWNSYSLKETVMGDLTLGTCTISNIAWDEAQGGFYRDYSNDGITQHFTAEKDGTTSMDKDYELGETSTILIQQTEAGIKVTNPFKLGAMPLPLTATFEGNK